MKGIIDNIFKKVIIAFMLIVTVLEVHAEPNEKKILPIYCVNTNGKKLAALSFDAAWGADDTDELLRILKKYNVKATFFLVGDWVRKYPEEVKRIAADGHDIGNHSNKHPHMAKMTKGQIKEDVMKAHEEIRKLIGKDMILFRAPYGEYNNTVMQALKECNYYVIQWDIDSLDWKEYGKEELIKRVVENKNLKPGSIILMHNNAKYTKDALDSIIKGLIDKGYTLVPISELIIKGDYTIDHEGRQHAK